VTPASTAPARSGSEPEGRACAVPGRSLRATMAALALLVIGLLVPGSALALDTPSPGSVYRDGPSGRYLVDGSWYSRPDPRDRGIRDGYPSGTALTGWSPVTIPHAANAGDFSQQSYLGSVHWYRKDFALPASPPRASWVLRFESVNYRATVWLNGRLIGRHVGGYLPFEIEAGAMRRGANRLVVRADSRRGLTDVPSLAVRRDGRFVGGWWNYAGILREVYLRRVDTLDFANVDVRPQLRCRSCAATVSIDALVRNMSRRGATASLEARVDGRQVTAGPARVVPKRLRRLRARVRIPQPRLWSPAEPTLYTVELLLRDGDGDVAQRFTVHTGIRSLKVRRGRLLLNDRPVSLRGASMHEDDLIRGAALRPSDLRDNIALLKELGATMTRSHYPLHPLTLELADREGILVWAEVPVYQMEDRLFKDDGVRRRSLRILREMVLRDRNHPSVVVWSVGNENTSKPGAAFRRYVRQAKRAAKRLDPGRLVGLAFPGYPTIGRQGVYASLDALGVNDYFGWYPGPNNSIANREDLGPYLDKLHQDYPRQALFVTEFGAEANRSGPATEKGTFEFQRDFLAYHLSVFAQKDYINGALVWILRDFRVKPNYDGGNPQPTPPINQKGLVDDSGKRKPAFSAVQQGLQALAPKQR
jgi:beta-galactosidase/beta-glucuronidase